ncbi:enoyl-CoA hydratase/isomerase family protein [Hypoxylon sp. FL1284]|nr:enoyl-CoA hydratase/isomerase family protein [Hypoxylon sp. FL1284]
MAADELFTIPIPATKSHPGGGVTCTCPAPRVYLLTFTSPPDNRLTPAFNAALMTALDAIEFGPHPPGVVVTTSAIAKFYSNGLDLQQALATPGFLERSLYPVFRRLLTYPMPTVALLNGHAFAGGLMLAMHHDYRVFAPRGFLCVNELEFGVPLMPPMSAVFRLKAEPLVYRELVLEARRFDAASARAAGLVDAEGGLDAALELIRDRALVKKAASTAYGMLKAEMYRESVALLDARGADAPSPGQWQAAEKKRKADGASWFNQWNADKAKL